ncbi:MAG: transcriptional regulator, Crp/Fnr family [Candidatus Sulfotelmatobacter sp.]|nr:transcriptional regulator, Crp/Fnr family [Candidatus Sulfotelmatobacter sp.]
MVPSNTRVSRSAPLIEGNPVRNELLLGLPAQECDSIFSQLTFVQLRTHDVLQDSEEPIKYAYFVDSGMVSILSVMRDGKSVEVGLTGKEGCTALQLVAGFKTSDTRALVQIAGTAFRVNSPTLVRVLRECPALARRMQQYALFLAMQGSQVAACNRLHEVDERLARWLLMSQDRIGIDGGVVPLTHEFLAHMLGTRRSSVTVAAGLLAKAGLITYTRGHVKIENRARLEDAACECYDLIVKHTDRWKKESA